MSRIHDVIVRLALRTEKAVALKLENKYVFEVRRSATKPQIREAVEQLFHVKVTDVRTMIRPGKKKRGGTTRAKKRAIVTLHPSHTLSEYAVEELCEKV